MAAHPADRDDMPARLSCRGGLHPPASDQAGPAPVARHSRPAWPGPAAATGPGPGIGSPPHGYRGEYPRLRSESAPPALLTAFPPLALEQRHRPGGKLPRRSCDESRPGRAGQVPDQPSEGGYAGASSHQPASARLRPRPVPASSYSRARNRHRSPDGSHDGSLGLQGHSLASVQVMA